ncbi:DNA primase [Candidatus Woesearchaeota archaeon]|nr:DNA primase [Candidatus Woesearchaeota archaeon]
MGKVSIVSAKYIIHATIDIEGVVDRPDVIGAIFGQTEGLLGSELELRELQRSGRIGRIEVNVDVKSGKTQGTIVIPSSLDKAETSIVGAALEIIQRIGPCNAKIKVSNIEDVRVSKRSFVIERAKELLKKMTETVLPDSQELADEVAYSVRVMEIQEYGKDRLPAGPAIDESDEIVVVEGRADVINLLKHGIKNGIAMNGTSVPQTIIDLSKKKVITAFVDGDRGGNLILKQLTIVADIDYVTRAPDGKEVEEITKKEIHKALRSRISGEQAKLELGKELERISEVRRPQLQQRFQPRHAAPSAPQTVTTPRPGTSFSQKFVKKTQATPEEKKVFNDMLENLIGTRGAHVLDSKLNILGKVPVSELQATITSLGKGIHAIVFDGVIDRDLAKTAERTGIRYLVGMDSKVKPNETRVSVLTVNDL